MQNLNDSSTPKAATLTVEQRKRIAQIVHIDCSLIPGATYYNAAEMAIEATLAQVAAPSPAAREAGDGVSAAFAKYDALIGSLEGCTDGGCVIRPPKGMHTNGGCRCVRHAMKMQRMAYAAAQLRKDLGALLREAGNR